VSVASPKDDTTPALTCTKGTMKFCAATFLPDTEDHYKPTKSIGSGAYGVVCAAWDRRYNKKVAIKKCTNAFDDTVDAKRILREIKLLAHFRHDNIVSLLDMIPPEKRDNKKFNDVYMVLGFMETDLHKIIYSKNTLTDEHNQYFIYQTLRALKYINSAGVLHRDLKPSNLLLNGNCDLKICDFGLARAKSSRYELTEYVVTRWYRAPEIMCSCHEYDEKIDVWSLGCILAELILRKPLFPGDHYIHMINLIFGLLGTPTKDDLYWISNEKALQYIKKLKPTKPVKFEKHFKKATPAGISLLKRMLVFNPHKRATVEECLAHPYLKALHNPKNEPKCSRMFNFEFEATANTDSNIRAMMLEEAHKARKRDQRRYAVYVNKQNQIDQKALPEA